MARNVGRPRVDKTNKSTNTRDLIMDAATELFTTQGYAMTSTHEIAEVAGVRQASMYYYFPSKSALLLTLLKTTMQPARDLSRALRESDLPDEQKLWTLVASEARQLLSTRWNVGQLYSIPTAYTEEFAEFHQLRKRMREEFENISARIVGEWDLRRTLPFQLAVSVTAMRPNSGTVPRVLRPDSLPKEARIVADAALDVLHAEKPEDREPVTLALLAELERKEK